jgi:hypothetical protein
VLCSVLNTARRYEYNTLFKIHQVLFPFHVFPSQHKLHKAWILQVSHDVTKWFWKQGTDKVLKLLHSSHWKDFHMPPVHFYIRAQELSLCLCVCVYVWRSFFPLSDWNDAFLLIFPVIQILWTILYTSTSFMSNFIINCISINTPTNLQYVILLFSSNYIPSDYKCTNKDVSEWMVRDSVKSFPSGHASMSAYTAIFMMVSLRILQNVLIMPANCVFWDLWTGNSLFRDNELPKFLNFHLFALKLEPYRW